jgi:hypothetical protein
MSPQRAYINTSLLARRFKAISVPRKAPGINFLV